VIEADKVNVYPICDVLLVANQRHSLRSKTRRKIMSFFERLKTAASAEWRAYTEHPFTNGLADGSLAETAFRHYLVQDYLFLIEFARAYALSVYKSPKLADMREAAAGLSAILDIEMDLHVKLCAGWGLSPSDLEQAPRAAEMLAYTRYLLDAGMRGDLLALKVALAPCVIGYAEIAARFASRPMRTLQRTHIAFGSPSMPVLPTSRSRRKRGRTWRVAPISTPPRRAKQS
jgi:thiaminase